MFEQVSEDRHPVTGSLAKSEVKDSCLSYFSLTSKTATQARSFQLSTKSLCRAAEVGDKDFKFIVDGVEYECNRFQALFFSPKIARMVTADRSVNHFILNCRDDNESFSDVMDLMSGKAVQVTTANFPILEFCARELENEELLAMVSEMKTNEEPLSLANVVSRLREKGSLKRDSRSEVDFIAAAFGSLDIDFVSTLTVDELEAVMNSDALVLKSADHLCQLLIELIERKGADYACLLRYVQIRELSSTTFGQLRGCLTPDMLEAGLWTTSTEVLRSGHCGMGSKALPNGTNVDCNMETRKPSSEHDTRVFVEYPEAKNFDDLSKKLCGLCGGLFSGDNTQVGYRFPAHPPYVTLKLNAARVSVTGYTMVAYNDGRYGYPASWIVEVSDDGKSWKTIDRQQTDALSQPRASRTFACAAPNEEPARFVRLRQTENGIKAYDNLTLGSIDFTGKYYLRLRDYPYRGEPLGGILWHRKNYTLEDRLGSCQKTFRYGFGDSRQLTVDREIPFFCHAAIHLPAPARVTHVTIKNGSTQLKVADVKCTIGQIAITLSTGMGQIWNPWEFKTFQMEDTCGFTNNIRIDYRLSPFPIPHPVCISEVDAFGAILEPEDE